MTPLTQFEKALAVTLKNEGFFSNDPNDHGGATTFGITEAVARSHGYQGEMEKLPLETAREIYRKDYWDKIRLDEIAEYHEKIAAKLFDIGVNMGIDDSGYFIQMAINSLSRNQKNFPHLKLDGIIGSKTIATLKKLGCDGDKTIILRAINALQGARYLFICQQDPTQEKFIPSWFRRISG